ncbi:MAG: ABC transporter ATP-binding protein [Lachnoclostridium sp.]|nr:ABC transporter ATP-binding protein [Lachnospira sp.]MCM1247888.1 ABC transporter ATP-binding protein [Lachnoclostridium sp.]MCM1534542.1 ABC transporter ATP-binding protein [Clostridium sp.]
MGVIAKMHQVCRDYGSGETIVRALKNVNVEIEKGEFVAVVGASGSGKTTFLNILGGLDIPTSGEVFIDGKALKGMSDDELTVFRRERIGFVFQNFNLLPMMSVYENIVLPIQIGGRDADEGYVKKVIAFLGLAGLENRLPAQLSGGQSQRTAIARALAPKPAVILADEPTGSLDSDTGNDVMDLFEKSVKEFGQTIVMITHNEMLAKRCNRILVMKDGVLADMGA